MSSMKAALLVIVLVAVAQLLQAAPLPTRSTVALSKGSSVMSKPTCCFKCPGGCYDKDQQRYVALQAVLKTAAGSKAQVCKPASKCPVLDAAKLWGSQPYQVVKRFNQLSLVGGTPKKYTSAIGVFQQFSGLDLTRSSLAITSGLLDFTSKDTWFAATNSSLSMAKSQVRGSLRSWTTTRGTLSFDRSQVDLTDTVVSAVASRWTIQDTGFTVNWTKAAVPAGPAFVGSFPFMALNSRIDVVRGVLKFVNVKDAYIVKSHLKGTNVTLVLINSNVRLIDSVLDLNNVVLKLENSTLLLSKVKMVADRFVSAIVKGSVTGLPKTVAPFKDISSLVLTAAGTGTFALSSVAK